MKIPNLLHSKLLHDCEIVEKNSFLKLNNHLLRLILWMLLSKKPTSAGGF